MKEFTYYITDVFTNKRFGGNPLAVFPEAHEIPEQLYQVIAREMNLSETTFILPSKNKEADFKLRIYTPMAELPMAGHPTIGTAFVVKNQNLLPVKNNLIIEEGVGNIKVAFEENTSEEIIWMNQPLPEFGITYTNRRRMAEILSLKEEELNDTLPMQVVSCGVSYLFVPVKTLQSVKDIKLRTDLMQEYLKDLPSKALFVYTTETEHQASTVHGRMFAPALGINEDPATGSAAGPLGAYLVKHGVVKRDNVLTCEQGFEMGRPSILYIKVTMTTNSFTSIQVGGTSILTAKGKLFID